MPFTVRNAPADLAHALDAWAKEEGISRNALVLGILERAVEEREQDKLDAQPYVYGWQRITLAQPATCAETGVTIQAGDVAYLQLWTDNRPGHVVCVEPEIE